MERETRVGMGYDAHRFAAAEDGRPLMLAGVPIPHERGLAGHSDADVALHAVVDALLGAAALGDIGAYFPSSDERWRGAASSAFVTAAVAALAGEGWRVVNVDVTIVAERPRLSPHVAAMRASLAALLGTALDRVSVKSKTSDGMGFTGREEGMACYAVALIARG
ncbi:MAG: 2-C-methyl-D-erythritol 2,4-cyclodiphosphate synthase [Chloroflexota bacterium]|nr:2-C-methyl-D-erythritol 2,4-cyclodiphosphate synthase [Chloroflexota bacterium]